MLVKSEHHQTVAKGMGDGGGDGAKAEGLCT